jgi:small conductance mechanosensitive channel
MDTASATQWKNTIIDYVGKNGAALGAAVAIVIAGFIVSGALGDLVKRWLDRKDLEPPVKSLISRVVRLVVLAIAIIIALGTCGINIGPLIALMGVAGVGIGLALQGVLGNLVSGLLIIFTKPFRVGEYIEIVGEYGQVNIIDLFTTTLIHPDRSRVVIPNRKISGEILHNYGTIRQHDITVGVTYSTNLAQAITIIRNVLAANPSLLKDPAPVVAVKDFGESAISIAIKPWSNLSDFGDTAAQLKLAIVEAFRANRIEIPFPQREVRVVNVPAALVS